MMIAAGLYNGKNVAVFLPVKRIEYFSVFNVRNDLIAVSRAQNNGDIVFKQNIHLVERIVLELDNRFNVR